MGRETVDELIARMMLRFPGESPAALNRYFAAVHQELAPLARELERKNAELRASVDRLNQQIAQQWRAEPSGAE